MPKKTIHENIYILISVLFYAAVVAGFFLLPWGPVLNPWYFRLLVLVGVALVYEVILKFIVKKFK